MPKFFKKKDKGPPTNPFPNLQDLINNLSIPPLYQASCQAQVDGTITIPSPSTAQSLMLTGSHPLREQKRRCGFSSAASIGQDRAFNQVCDFLREGEVGTVGIYGMGGVGKTTLLKKIGREFLAPSGFNAIWVAVSKSVDVDRIQKEIMEGVDLLFDPNETRHKRAQLISKAAVKKKVALLIDDIWEALDFEELNIFEHTDLDPTRFKVIFTTRLKRVCAHMQPDRDIRVECLGWDDSWDLFQRSVGRDTLESHHTVMELARKVAQECMGLPLALTIIGKAMACKDSPQAWKHTLVTLRKSPSMVSGVEKSLFAQLKLSYDYLPGDVEKKCFLYCCLYREDENIISDYLVEYWISEGFVGVKGSLEEACNSGYDIIGTLQVAHLLERVDHGVSKMHDVIRDMGLWILSELQQNFFAHGDVNQTTKEIDDNWRAAHRICVLDVQNLPQQPICCNLSTLIFHDNGSFSKRVRISSVFYQSMCKLKVLEMVNIHFVDDQDGIQHLVELRFLYIQNTNLERLPIEIGKLTKLNILYLIDNWELKELPKTIGQLHDLRKLRFDSARVLPSELGSLRKLECLIVSTYLFYGCLEQIPSRMFENLASLRTLSMGARNVDMLPADLWDLTRLEDLTIKFEEEDGDNMNVLIHGLQKLSHSLRRLCISSWSIAGWSQLLATLLRKMLMLSVVNIEYCPVQELVTPKSSSISGLKELIIGGCYELKKIDVGPSELENLCVVHIFSCESLEHIVGLQYLKRLVELSIDNCKIVDVIEEQHVGMEEEGVICFPNLHILSLCNLTRLRKICSHRVLFPSLKQFTLENCPELERLPRGLMNGSNKLKDGHIWGSYRWWNELQWEDEDFRSFLLQFFSPQN